MYYIDKKILKRKKGGNHVNKELKRKREDCKEGLPGDGVHITADTKQFLLLANDPITRPSLLARLQELGLLSEFLEVES